MSIGGYTDICACGHPVGRHELVDTEYARCEMLGACFCSGWVHVAVRVIEDSERVNGVKSNARFFRRRFRLDGSAEHPLIGGIRKARENGIAVEWIAYECDRCGGAGSGDGFLAYMADVEDEREPQIPVTEISGRTVLLCDACDNEVKEKLLTANTNVAR